MVELMIAIGLIAIFIVPMISLLSSMRFSIGGMAYASSTPTWYDKFISIDEAGNTNISTSTSTLKDIVGKRSCRNFNWQSAIVTEPVFADGITLSQKMGTSSLPTAVGLLGKYLIITTNSSSTTDPDIFVLRINNSGIPNAPPTFTIVSALDIGPGLADMFIAEYTAFVADTSVKDQAKAIDLADPEHPVVGRAYTFPGSN